MFAQGDVLIVEVSEIPTKATPIARIGGRIVLAEGEATGHAHTIADPLVEMVGVSEEVDRWLRVGPGGATVVHQEHQPVTLPTGTYRVVRQREYFPDAVRLTAD